MSPLILFIATTSAFARTPAAQKQVLEQVSFSQNLDAQVPLKLPFRDEAGRPVQLSAYFQPPKPVILTLVYYECPMLCTETLNGLVRAIRSLPFDAGRQYQMVTVSFEPREKPALAEAKKKNYLERYGREGAEHGWAFLTGDEGPIRRLTDSVGFHYAYDPELKQYAHPLGIVVLTPAGRISHYFFGVEFSPKDLRLALLQASAGRIGSPVDRLLLACYHYDPLTGKYNLAILRVMRWAGLATVAALALAVWMLTRRGGRRRDAR